MGSNLPQKPAKIRFPDNGGEEGDATEGSNVDEMMCDLEESANTSLVEESFPDGDDKTSADYYFDSYSHFGTLPCSELYLALKLKILVFTGKLPFLDFSFICSHFVHVYLAE